MRECRTSIALTKALRTATADLRHVDAGRGLLRFSSLGLGVLITVWCAWQAANPVVFGLLTAGAGGIYLYWFICTHDATHHTLTGWSWFDEIAPRLLSYPMLWGHGTYTELHRLHHGWNGQDLRDPERVQWTIADYRRAPAIVQWYVRHQWPIDVFVFGGFGLLVKTFWHGWRLRSVAPRLRWQLLLDGLGIVITQTLLVTWAISQGQLLKYIVFWLILERVIGVMTQTRDHLEHFNLWGKADNHLLTQLYASRNLATPPIVNWLMGGLPYHSVHHAFPDIPCHRLPEAFDRIQVVLAAHGFPRLSLGQGYLREALRLGVQPTVIGEINLQHPTSRHDLVFLGDNDAQSDPNQFVV